MTAGRKSREARPGKPLIWRLRHVYSKVFRNHSVSWVTERPFLKGFQNSCHCPPLNTSIFIIG